MRQDAELIAKIVRDTPTEERGELFLQIGEQLRKLTQGYTSTFFGKIAVEYGFKKD